jgi:hypothetical protein
VTAVNLSDVIRNVDKQQEVARLDAGDRGASAELAKRIKPLPVNELSTDIRTRLDSFNKWAGSRSARRCPAKPATVALWALEQADLGVPVQQILAQLDAIEKLHDKFSLSNPVRTAIVQAALETIIKVDPPRSWPREDKVRFARLDPDTREIIAKRENDRDKELRRLQARAAEAKKRLSNGAGTKPVQQTDDKELDNDDS